MIHPMWRTCVGAFLCVLFLAAADAATGDWDRSYGIDGRLPLRIASAPSVVWAWQPQPDGKIVTAGRVQTATGQPANGYVVARLNAHGTADTTFDGDGFVQIMDGAGAIDIALLGDGRLLVAGQSLVAGRIGVLRLNADGSRDSTFGTGGGMTFTNPLPLTSFLFAKAPDGAAILAGTQSQVSGQSIVVARVTAAGVLDASFGLNGRVEILVPSSLLDPRDLVVQPDGSIVVGGMLSSAGRTVPFIGRLTNSGQLDTTFGANGVAELPVLETQGFISHVASSADGKIVASGSHLGFRDEETCFLVRLHANGTVDQSFGSGGRIILPANGLSSLSLDPDGKAVVGGTIDQFRGNPTWLARYNADGSPDVTFGSRGRSLTDFSTGTTRISFRPWRVERDADGGYRAVINSYDSATGYASALVRFAASGTSPGVIGIHTAPDTLEGSFGVQERAGSFNVTAYRTGGSEGAVSVRYRLVGASATAGQDFVASTGTLAFNEGEIAKTFTFEVLDDVAPEAEETFYVELFEPTGGAGLSRSRVNVRILDDTDTGSTVALLSTFVHALENAGSMRLLARRTGDLSTELTVNYATSDATATAGADYSATSGSVTWGANEGGVRAFDVPLVNDGTIESLEQLYVTISSSDPVAIISSTSRIANIRISDDDDGTQTPKLGFKTSSVAVAEGAGSVTLEVYRVGDASQAISAAWSTAAIVGEGATGGQDFSHATGTLSWAAGDSAPKILTIPILEDASSELPEDFVVFLSPVSPASLVNSDGMRVTISDNDPPASTPTVSVGPDASFAESIGTASVNVTMSGAPGWNVTVYYEVVRETAGAADFTLASGSLTWVSGDPATKQLSIPIVADTLDEIDESFSIQLTSLSGGARFGVTRARCTIVDDDATPAGQPAPVLPGVRLESSSVSVRENDQAVTLRVLRTGDIDFLLNVPYVITSGTAGSPDDYFARGGLLTWYAGTEYSQDVVIYLNGDAQPELDETFNVRFFPNLPGLGMQSEVTATVTLLDDDRPGPPSMVEFVGATQSVNESATTVTLQVGRTGNTAIASSVDYATVVGSATSTDFVTATGTLTWQANDTSLKLITLTLTPDTNDEPDESFTVNLSNASAGTQIGSGSATVTIVDDDSAPSAPGPGGSGSSGGGGGGQESLIALLLWAALVSVRLVSNGGGVSRPRSKHH